MKRIFGLIAAAVLMLLSLAVSAQQKDPIKIGQTMPFSGPASSYSIIGKASSAVFAMFNEHGGINGRKIELISLDDGYSPPKTVEQTRKLVESEEVLLLFSNLGAATNVAIQKYVNAKKVPQLFIASGASNWGQPDKFPWTMGWQPNYQSEGRAYARYVLQSVKSPKIAILYQNDDFGRDLVRGLMDGLGSDAKSMVVMQKSYEVTDPTIDSQMISLAGSGANVFLNATTPKFAAQAIRKASEIGWNPSVHFVAQISSSVGTSLKPAGLDKSKGVISIAFLKDALDAKWKGDKEIAEWNAWMDKYLPGADKNDFQYIYGYSIAYTLIKVLEQAGDNLSRENIMAQAANLKDVHVPMLLPGILLNTSAKDFFPLEQMQLQRFNGEHWELFGDVIDGRQM
jgi:branched-chain amino acid transport system substrate-binding protein